MSGKRPSDWRRRRSGEPCNHPRWPLSDAAVQWSRTSLHAKLIEVGARIVRHSRYIILQLAELTVPRVLFAAILRRINRLRGPPASAT